MTREPFIDLSDDQLRQAIRDIAAWPDPSVAPDLPESGAVISLDTFGPARRLRPAHRLALVAAVVAIGLLAAVLVGQRSTPPTADQPSVEGVLDRLPEKVVTLQVIDLGALRALDPPGAKEATVLRQAELEATTLLPELGVELLDVDLVTVVARSSEGPAVFDAELGRSTLPRFVTIVGTEEDPSAVGSALRGAGFEEQGGGRFERGPMPGTDGGAAAHWMAARVEPGYLTLVLLPVEPPAGYDLLREMSGPPAGLAALRDASQGFYLFSGRVDAAVPGLECGAAEAATYGPWGYRLLAVTGTGGTVRGDLEPGVLGQGTVGAQSRSGDVTTVIVEPGPVGLAGLYPYSLFTGDVARIVDC